MSRREKASAWFSGPATKLETYGAAVLFFAVCAGAWWTFFDSVTDRIEVESGARGRDTAENRKRDDRLNRRLVHVELGAPALCARSSACRRAIRDRQAPQRRDKREARKPEQVADRPPRQPSPPTVRQPDTGGGDDPPTPPGASTPSTPPSSPNAPQPVVQVDIPPLDLDGDKGLLPQLLPDVNLPPVDLPGVRIGGE